MGCVTAKSIGGGRLGGGPRCVGNLGDDSITGGREMIGVGGGGGAVRWAPFC